MNVEGLVKGRICLLLVLKSRNRTARNQIGGLWKTSKIHEKQFQEQIVLK